MSIWLVVVAALSKLWVSQSLKSPTTDTAPAGYAAGSANVTRTVPARLGLVTLIN